MTLYDNLQFLLLIPKSIETVLFIIIIFLINKKNKGISWKDRPQFHKLFLTGMIGWFVYIFLDMIIYVFAPFSMDISTPSGLYTGYSLVYPSLFAVNILRDIGFVGSMVMYWAYLIASFNLRYDEEKTKSIFSNKLIIAIMVIVSVIVTAGDAIGVTVTAGSPSVSGVFNGFAGFSIFLNVSIYLSCAILLFKTLQSLTSEEPSKEFKKRIIFFMWGVLFMGFGHIYWLVLGLLAMYSPGVLILASLDMGYIYYFIGHGLWTISPVLIYFGFAKGSKE